MPTETVCQLQTFEDIVMLPKLPVKEFGSYSPGSYDPGRKRKC